jgi:dTDP-4-amino-4,6-dideoxygalactose transaminase
MGSSFLLSELVASYLLPQIIEYKKIIKSRSKIYLRYLYNLNKWLKDEFYITNNYKFEYNYHTFVILLKNSNREKFLKYLKKYNINAVISYVPLHTSKAGKIYYSKDNQLNNTNILSKKLVRLPMHNHLSLKEVDYVCDKIKKYFKK